MRDYVGWDPENWIPHVEDDLRTGAIGMIQQYHGDTVRITAAVCKGLVGELKTIDFEEPDENFFGVRIDEIEGWIFFGADELEKVEPDAVS